VEAEDWCYGEQGLRTCARWTRASWSCRMALRSSPRPARGAGGTSEDGGRTYRPERGGRRPGAPGGRTLDTKRTRVGKAKGVLKMVGQ